MDYQFYLSQHSELLLKSLLNQRWELSKKDVSQEATILLVFVQDGQKVGNLCDEELHITSPRTIHGNHRVQCGQDDITAFRYLTGSHRGVTVCCSGKQHPESG